MLNIRIMVCLWQKACCTDDLDYYVSSILAGCINNDNDEENTPSDNDEPVNSMIYISSGSQTELYDNGLGTMIYVEDEKQFQYCSSSGWTVLEIDLPNGSNGTNGTSVDGSDSAME